jgi:hypothetical protein
MIKAAYIKSEANGIQSDVYMQYGYKLMDESTMERLTLLDKTAADALRVVEPGSNIKLVCDDVRTGVAIRYMLRDHKIDSASLLFPGAGNAVILTGNESAKLIAEGRHQKAMGEFITQFRRGAYLLASEKVKPGGFFVIGERAVHKFGNLAEESLKELKSNMGHLADYWAVDKSAMLEYDLGKFTGNLDLVLNSRPGGKLNKKQGLIHLIRLTRNQLIFKERIPEVSVEESACPDWLK